MDKTKIDNMTLREITLLMRKEADDQTLVDFIEIKKKIGMMLCLFDNVKNNFSEQEQILTREEKEKFTQEIDTFWRDTYTKDWSLNNQDLSKVKFVPDLLSPIDIPWQDIAKESDNPKEFGKYITNPETALLDYEKLGKPEIYNPNEDIDLDKWLKKNKLNKTRASVMQYVAEKFSDTHYLPGIEYQKYLFQNQKKKGVIPKELKDGNWYFFPGAAFRDSDGRWNVPGGRWDSCGEVWERYGNWARNGWVDRERVLLYKRNDS